MRWRWEMMIVWLILFIFIVSCTHAQLQLIMRPGPWLGGRVMIHARMWRGPLMRHLLGVKERLAQVVE